MEAWNEHWHRQHRQNLRNAAEERFRKRAAQIAARESVVLTKPVGGGRADQIEAEVRALMEATKEEGLTAAQFGRCMDLMDEYERLKG